MLTSERIRQTFFSVNNGFGPSRRHYTKAVTSVWSFGDTGCREMRVAFDYWRYRRRSRPTMTACAVILLLAMNLVSVVITGLWRAGFSHRQLYDAPRDPSSRTAATAG